MRCCLPEELVERIDPRRALDTLLASEGDLGLACELLGTPTKPISTASLVKALADEPQGLQRALRVFSMIEAHDLRRKIKLIVESTLPDLGADDAVDAYIKLTDKLTDMTAPTPQSSQTNIMQIVFDTLPREAANAVKGLAQLGPEQLEQMRRQLQGHNASAHTAIIDAPEGSYKAS